MKRYFISPHMDDIAFCCFGSLMQPPFFSLDTTIINVFSRSKFSFQEKPKKGVSISRIRRNEEVSFCNLVKCQVEFLDFPDTSIRYESYGQEYKILSREDPIYSRVAKKLIELLKGDLGNCPIYIPLGVSKHVDHLIVRDIIIQIFEENNLDKDNIYFYEDLPYANKMSELDIINYVSQQSLNVEPFIVSLDGLWQRKCEALKLYKSQLDVDTIQHIHGHAIRVGRGNYGERLWSSSFIKPSFEDNKSLAWVSWEASQSLGGTGVVISNIVNDATYQETINRTILVGPLYPPKNSDAYDPLENVFNIASRLNTEIVYASNQGINLNLSNTVTNKFKAIEEKHGVGIVYLRQRKGLDHTIERILIDFSTSVDIRNVYSPSLRKFLSDLKSELGIELQYEDIRKHSPFFNLFSTFLSVLGENLSDNVPLNIFQKQIINENPRLYGHVDNDFIYGLLLAEPAFEAIQAILAQNEFCTLVSQEYFSLPTSYAAIIHRNKQLANNEWKGNSNSFQLKTLFYAGEVRTIRNLVEGHTAKISFSENDFAIFQLKSDVLVRNLINKVIKSEPRKSILDLKELNDLATHSDVRLLQHAWKLDRVMAVSDHVFDELEFIDKGFRRYGDNAIFYHGNRFIETNLEWKKHCKKRLLYHANRAWGLPLDVNEDVLIVTRIARPMLCKAFKRDFEFITKLSSKFKNNKKKILYLLITSWKNKNTPTVVAEALNLAKVFEAEHNNLAHVRVINAAKWPEQAEIDIPHISLVNYSRDDLHRATDISLGLSTYESFGLSPLEPLSCGAICIISDSLGSSKLIKHTLKRVKKTLKNIIFYKIVERLKGKMNKAPSEKLFEFSENDIRQWEEEAMEALIDEVIKVLPRNDLDLEELILNGQKLSKLMAWSKFIKNQFLPALNSLLTV